jgi:hypothetical protein
MAFRKFISLSLAFATLVAVAPALTCHAQRGDSTTIGGDSPISNELDQQTKDVVKKGLDWLSKNITSQGNLSGNGGDSAGIVALAGLAFLANGSMPGDGPYGKDADLVLQYVLRNCQPTGLIASPSDGSPMYGHGFASLFLAEAYGMSQRQDLKEKLENAIRLIVKTQNPEGGWRYQPAPQDADISVTICQIMALRAARNAGIKVPAEVIDKATDYVKKSQESDGGFAYMLTSRGSAYPRSAAGTACLFYVRTGAAYENEIKKGVAYIKGHMPTAAGGARDGSDYHFYYGNYYATQAMFMAGGDDWKTFWPAMKKILISRQQANGSWSEESGTGAVYSTSMALIMLQIPNRLLPILQK